MFHVLKFSEVLISVAYLQIYKIWKVIKKKLKKKATFWYADPNYCDELLQSGLNTFNVENGSLNQWQMF